jgi:type IV secretion system protein VirB4
MLRSALDARFVLYHHIIRRKVTVDLPGDFPDPFSRDLDRQWQARLGQRQLFVNEQFLTLVRRPARGKTGWPERLARWINRQDDLPDPGALRDLDSAIGALLANLGPYGARRLGPMPRRMACAASRWSCFPRFTTARCDQSPLRMPMSIQDSTFPIRVSASGSMRWNCRGRRAKAWPPSFL